ncbi:MAG: HAD family phosphatase [Nanoarchaeota archaeon]|nr:HAD family phosphatase [Nanoarchaeota archaeon]
MRKIAFLDFDGTLSSGYISMAFLDHVYEKEIYAEDKYKEQMGLLKQLKTGELSYDEWCKQWGEVWAQGLKGVSWKEARKEAKEFFEGFKPNIYPSSYELVQLLKENDYHTVCVSVGASEVIGLAARELGIDKCHSTILRKKNGLYTGEPCTNLHMPGGKVSRIEEILRAEQFSRVIAMGDSVGDTGMLSLADIAVALNPSKELEAYARSKNWHVFTADNIVEGLSRLL